MSDSFLGAILAEMGSDTQAEVFTTTPVCSIFWR